MLSLRLHQDIAAAMQNIGPGDEVDKLLAQCPDAECFMCASLVCPHMCTLHFHHDGCPACAEAEAEKALLVGRAK